MKYELWISVADTLYLIRDGFLIEELSLYQNDSSWYKLITPCYWKAFRFSTDELLDSWEE